MASLGDRVKEKRISLGLSQAELARRVSKILRRKVTQVAIHHIEARGDVSPRFVVELADVLGVSLSWLQHGRENRPPLLLEHQGHRPADSRTGESPDVLVEMLMNKIYDPADMPEGSEEEKAIHTLARHLRKMNKPG